jgi:hypothetical protein
MLWHFFVNWFTQIWLKSITQQFTHITLSLECFVVDVVAKYSWWYVVAVLNWFSSLGGAVNYLISHVLRIVSQIGILEMKRCSLLLWLLSKIGQLFSKRVSKLWISIRSLRFMLDWMNGHNSKAALIESRLFFHLLLYSSRVILVDIYVLHLFPLLRQMTHIFLLILERLLPHEINCRDEVVSSWIKEKLRFEGYIFLLSTLYPWCTKFTSITIKLIMAIKDKSVIISSYINLNPYSSFHYIGQINKIIIST